jgi:hypothetical protein
MPPPTNVKGIRRFLGTCGYYRKFIKNYSNIASPLSELTKKDIKFNWTDSCQDAFEDLKNKLTSAPVLAYPDYNKEFMLHCDASNHAVGAVLNQKYDKSERPIGFFSRKLRGPEVSYSVSEREALAIFEAIKFFTPYLYLNRFTVVTDHSALKFIFKNKNTVPRIARWSLLLSNFDYDIQYKSGKHHHVPDMLSRNNYNDNYDSVAAIEENSATFDLDNLKAAQHSDPFWGNLVKFLSGDKDVQPPKVHRIEEFFVDDDEILYRIPKDKKNRTNIQIVVPQSLINKALELSHDSDIAAHSGILRSLERSRSYFFWYNQARDVQRYVKSCLNCQKLKWQGQETGMLGKFKPVSAPLERVGIDLIELSPSYSGNKYILTVIDHFSRYVAAFPLPNKTADTVTRAMISYITDNSVPKEIVSDRGTEFCNDLFKRVCKTLQSKNKFTSAYHPMANGATEKANSTIKKTLSHLSAEDRFMWDAQLPLTVLAINTAYQTSIKEIPFFLHHGRDARLPFNDLVNNLPALNYAEEDYSTEMSLRLSKAFKHVKMMTEQSHDNSAKYYNRRVKAKTSNIQVGSLVLLRNETSKSETPLSWPTRYLGPYRVLDKNDNNFVIQGVYADNKTQTVHLNRIKKAILRDDTPFPFNNISNEDVHNATVDIDLPDQAVENDNSPVPPQRNTYNLRSRR